MNRLKLIAIAIVAVLAVPMSAMAAFNRFSDIKVTDPWFDAVSYVEGQGVVNGYADGTFKPGNTINRAEFTKIVVLGFQKIQYQNFTANYCFDDVPEKAWFATYVCFANRYELVQGYPDLTFKPEKKISFVEAAKIIANAAELETKEGDGPWYKTYVKALEAKNAIPTSVQSFEHLVTRGEMAEMIYRLRSENEEKASKTYEQLGG